MTPHERAMLRRGDLVCHKQSGTAYDVLGISTLLLGKRLVSVVDGRKRNLIWPDDVKTGAK